MTAPPRRLPIAQWLGLAAIAIVTTVPFTPVMPAAQLDPSWAFAINEAVARRLAFGESLIFSFGPYASVFSQLYHPATDALMLGASAFLALASWLALAVLTADGKWRAALAFSLVSLAFRWERDVQLFLPALLAGVMAHRTVLTTDVPNRDRWGTAALVVTFAALGLLPLVKGSALVLALAIAGVSAVCGLAARRPWLALVSVLVPPVSMLGFWMLAGQPPSALPSYVARLTELAAGYADAMSLRGDAAEVTWYLVASAVILLVVGVQRQWPRPATLLAVGVFASFLFVVFKAAFVRHDVHALIAGCGVMMTALTLPFIVRPSWAWCAIGCAMVPWAIVDRHFAATSPPVLLARMVVAGMSAGSGVARRVSDPDWPRGNYHAARAALAAQAGFPQLEGTTDIYSFNQSYLLASGNAWSPRPVLQSYAAFTPALADRNRRHLLGDRAPDHVILSVEPIDGHLPALEDGVSWPVMMSRYRLVQSLKGFLVLSRRVDAADVPTPRETSSETHQFGEAVAVPTSAAPTWARIEVVPSPLGRLASLLFKSSEIQIQLELTSGERRPYRFIPGMAAAGFIVSPLVDTTAEFGALLTDPAKLDAKVVRSLTIGSANDAMWNRHFQVRWGHVAPARPAS